MRGTSARGEVCPLGLKVGNDDGLIDKEADIGHHVLITRIDTGGFS